MELNELLTLIDKGDAADAEKVLLTTPILCLQMVVNFIKLDSIPAPEQLSTVKSHVTALGRLARFASEVKLNETFVSRAVLEPYFICDIEPCVVFAARYGLSKVVGELLGLGHDINLVSKSGESPLRVASQNGHIQVVKVLLKARAEVDQAGTDDATPLWAASEHGHTQVVQALLGAGAEVDKANTRGTTPLWIASRNGHTQVVQALINAGAAVDKADPDDQTPLIAASEYGHTQVVQALLGAGAEVDKANTDGTTPLWVASSRGHTQIVKALLGAGASVEDAIEIEENAGGAESEDIKVLLQRHKAAEESIAPLLAPGDHQGSFSSAMVLACLSYGPKNAGSSGVAPAGCDAERNTFCVRLLIAVMQAQLAKVSVPGSLKGSDQLPVFIGKRHHAKNLQLFVKAGYISENPLRAWPQVLRWLLTQDQVVMTVLLVACRHWNIENSNGTDSRRAKGQRSAMSRLPAMPAEIWLLILGFCMDTGLLERVRGDIKANQDAQEANRAAQADVNRASFGLKWLDVGPAMFRGGCMYPDCP